jgi:HTH-type transcriptional regulator/antitoxin HigA
MNIKPIRSQEDLTVAFARVEQLWGADIDSPEGDELEILALLIEKVRARPNGVSGLATR